MSGDGGLLSHASQEEARRKDEKPAIITLEDVAKFAADQYGLGGIDVTKVKELDSYDDRNYYIPNVTYTHSDGRTETLDVIFKVHNGVESSDQSLIEAHNAARSLVTFPSRASELQVIENFNARVAPRIPSLRKGIIQNDANEQNLVIDTKRETLTGILDFGDCLCTCIVFELAICLAYLMLGKDDPLGTAQHIYAGYVQEFPLTQEEKELLHTLVCGRMVQSVTMGAYSYSKDPGNEYLLITAKTGWELLELLDTISPAEFLAKMEGGA